MDTRTKKILDLLEGEYPHAECELEYSSVFQLAVAVILSAQCTDKRVNIVTRELFKHFQTAKDFAGLTQEELAPHIFSCGFYNNKSKIILKFSRTLMEDYGGEVPKELEILRKLLGRKTANVVYAVGFGGQAIAVDTHVFRVANRLEIAKGTTPLEVERGLEKAIREDLHSAAHHLLLFHGRYTCKSQTPNCSDCKVFELCNYNKKNLLSK